MNRRNFILKCFAACVLVAVPVAITAAPKPELKRKGKTIYWMAGAGEAIYTEFDNARPYTGYLPLTRGDILYKSSLLDADVQHRHRSRMFGGK